MLTVKDGVEKWRVVLFCGLIVLFSIFNGAAIGYFTFYVDVWEGAVLFGIFFGVIPAILIWMYIDQKAQIV